MPQRYFLSARGLSGNPDKSIPTWQSVTGFTQNCPAGHDRVVAGEAAYTLKIRSGCAGAGKAHWCRQKRRERSRRFKTRPFSSQSSLTLVEMATVRQFRPLPGIMRAASQTIRLLRSICTTELLRKQGGSLELQEYRDDSGPQVAERKTYSEQTFSTYKESDSSATLKAKTGNIGNGGECLVAERVVRWIVRRLTPTECERLQDTRTDGQTSGNGRTPKGKSINRQIRRAIRHWETALPFRSGSGLPRRCGHT